MISTVWSRLRSWIGRERDDGDGGSDPSAFSLLDASVNYSHGQSDGQAVRELQKASEQANELAEARREKR